MPRLCTGTDATLGTKSLFRLFRWKRKQDDADVDGFFDLGHFCRDTDPIRVSKPVPNAVRRIACTQNAECELSVSFLPSTHDSLQILGEAATTREDKELFSFEISVRYFVHLVVAEMMLGLCSKRVTVTLGGCRC